MTVQFSQNVGASLSAADVGLRNLTTSMDVPAANLIINFNGGTNTLTIGPANGVVLPAGNYRFTLLARGITNASSQALATDEFLDFFVLPGDANGDRVVNDRDVFQVWQSSLIPLGQQNLNNDLTGDGRVTAADVSMVKGNYLNRLPSESVEILAAEVNSGRAQRSRLTDLTVVFSENVGASVTMADVVLRNLTTFADVASTSLTLNYDYATNTLTIGLANGVILPAGDYQMTLRAGGVADGGGRTLKTDVELQFHILNGDTNGDRIVNDTDLFLVWRNLLQPPVTRDPQFDLNNDRTVSLADVDVIRASYQNELGGLRPARASVTAAAEDSGENGGETNPSLPMADSDAAMPAISSTSAVVDSQFAVLVPIQPPASVPPTNGGAQITWHLHPIQIDFGWLSVSLRLPWPESSQFRNVDDRVDWVGQPDEELARGKRVSPISGMNFQARRPVRFSSYF